MQNIILTSSVSSVAHDIPKHLNKKPPDLRLLFIDTPTEVETGDMDWLRRDKQSLVKAGFNLTYYTFTDKTKEQIQDKLKNIDVLYISGGNQFHLLKKIQQSNSANVIRDFVKQGKIYIGCSAGSIITGPDIYPTRFIDEAQKSNILKSYKGLGLVDFNVLPHWGDPDFKNIYFNYRLEYSYNTRYKLIFLTDNQYIIVKGQWLRIIDVKD